METALSDSSPTSTRTTDPGGIVVLMARRVEALVKIIDATIRAAIASMVQVSVVVCSWSPPTIPRTIALTTNAAISAVYAITASGRVSV